ncbi:MAG: exodeoxyribonuclease VII large subunit, partial [Gemmatimonadota bacterium]
HLGSVAGKVEALSPLSTLKRGYAVPLGPEGRVLKSTGAFHVGGRFDLRVVDGRIRCETIDVTEEGKG